jgi:hypothetical protein
MFLIPGANSGNLTCGIASKKTEPFSDLLTYLHSPISVGLKTTSLPVKNGCSVVRQLLKNISKKKVASIRKNFFIINHKFLEILLSEITTCAAGS